MLDAPLSELLDDGAYREERWDVGIARPRHPLLRAPGETVWGATARILTGFLEHLVAGR